MAHSKALSWIYFLVICKAIFGAPISSTEKQELTIFEGDIILNGAKPEDLHYEDEVKRVVQRDRNYLWRRRIVPFEIDTNIAAAESVIKESLAEISRVSCVTFKQHENEMNWIKFENGSGCASHVGKLFWNLGGQSIVLDVPCYKKGIIVHEVLHALGFWHEQNRADRDKYIEILWENVMKGKEHNFKQYDHFLTDTLGTNYDTGSIMHYGNYYFSKNGQMTMASIQDRNKRLGSTGIMSDLDVIRLNALYSCKDQSSEFVSSWSGYSPCDGNCMKTRQRFCSHSDITKCPGADYNGIETEAKECVKDATECYAPVDGHWGRWSAWGLCSASCGRGTVKRTRFCNNPSPLHGGMACVGISESTSTCKGPSCLLGPHDCDFEGGNLCHWALIPSVFGDFKWQIHQGETPSSGTGPSTDSTGEQDGHYAFVEASSPAMPGDTSQLVSGRFSNLPGMCLTFKYHMYGDYGMGQLNVYHKDVGTGTMTKLWGTSGNHEDKWLNKTIAVVPTRRELQVVIEAVRGATYKSDIAIDNIHITEQSCALSQESQLLLRPIGCFQSRFPGNNSRFFPVMKDLRQQINWHDLNATIKQCQDLVKGVTNTHQTLFALEFWGECWYGNGDLSSLVKLPASVNCMKGVGEADAIMAYEMSIG